MTHEESVEILATYALDAVGDAEREAIEQHLAECPRCRTELDALREVSTAMGNSVEPLPDGLWSSIAGRLPARHDEAPPPMPRLVAGDDDDHPAPAPAVRPSPPAPGKSRGRIATIGAVVVAAAAIVTVLGVSLVRADNRVSQLQTAARAAPPSSVVSALEAAGHKVVDLDGADQHMVAQFVVVDGRGYLVSSTLPTLSDEHTYQLWGFIGGRPISLGLLGQSPNQATFTMAGSESASKLAITVEPATGATTPSRPVVAKGTV